MRVSTLPLALRAAFLGSLLAVGFGACAGAPPVDPAQFAAAEARLMDPFRQDRAVYGQEIEIVISANFYDQVVQPATSRELHRLEREQKDGDAIYRWTNATGGLQAPLRFKIANTELAAERLATLRVLGRRHDMTCKVAAIGSVIEAPGRGEIRGWQEYRITDGAVQRR